MARLLILTLGSRGDVQPYAALGAALAAGGHDVTLSTGQGFDALVAEAGLTPAPISIDVQAMIDRPEIQEALRSLRGRWRAFRLSQGLMRRQLDDLWAVAARLRPDLIVYHPKAFVAPYLARRLGAVAVPGFLQPAFVATGAFANPLVRPIGLGPLGHRLSGRAIIAMMRLGYRTILRAWLKRQPDVPARPALDALRGYHPAGRPVPQLHGHSRHLVARPPDWPAAAQVTGYWFATPAAPWDPPAALARFLESGPAPIYVGFGSMPAVDADRTAGVVLEALRQTGLRAVLAKGWGALSAAGAGAAVHVVDSAPHDWLFPRCRAVVHHGGAGTTHEGLRWGRPTLVCPVFGDQPFWGRVVAGLGAGPAPLPLRRLTASRLATALGTLRDGAFDDAAAALGERIRAERGAETAAGLIDDMLAQ